LLTAVVILAVVFFLLRLLLHQFVAHGRGGLSAGVHRSFGSLGRSARHGLDASALAALPVTAYSRKPEQADGGGPASASTSGAVGGADACATRTARSSVTAARAHWGNAVAGSARRGGGGCASGGSGSATLVYNFVALGSSSAPARESTGPTAAAYAGPAAGTGVQPVSGQGVAPSGLAGRRGEDDEWV